VSGHGTAVLLKKPDKSPSPHGFARAEDYIGYEKNITFLIENCAGRYTQAGRPMSALGH
jgi:hypothetical protein